MPNSQIHLYSTDTGHFYGNREKRLSEKIFHYQNEINDLEHENRRENLEHENEINDSEHDVPESKRRTLLIRHKRNLKRETEQKLAALLSNKFRQNEKTGGKDHVRRLRGQDLRENKIIVRRHFKRSGDCIVAPFKMSSNNQPGTAGGAGHDAGKRGLRGAWACQRTGAGAGRGNRKRPGPDRGAELRQHPLRDAERTEL